MIVQAKKISKSYQLEHGLVEALRPIDLEIFAGESLAIIGPSGSGKSTLLHLLGCQDLPTTGEYLFNNQDVALLSDRELSQLRSRAIGFVFQSFYLLPGLNIYENVVLPFLYQNRFFSEEEIKKKVFHAIERVRLTHRLHHFPSQLSGGEAQRVAIARALVIDPLMILADEPTGNLDVQTGREILRFFQEINNEGATLVIVTHDPKIASMCKRVISLDDY